MYFMVDRHKNREVLVWQAGRQRKKVIHKDTQEHKKEMQV